MFARLMRAAFAWKKTIAVVCLAALAVTAGAVGLQHLLAATAEQPAPPRPEPPPNIVAQNDAKVAVPADDPATEKRPELKGRGHAAPPGLLQAAMGRLHNEAVHRFLSAPENGMRRMIVLPKKVESPWQVPFWSPSEVTKETRVENKDDLARIHTNSLNDFLDPKFGVPANPGSRGVPNDVILFKDVLDKKKHKDWEIKTLDLVGLVKYDHPVVYVSEKLPDMKSLKDVPTRFLDFFELAGVEELQKGENLFIRTKEETVRVLGAIRAQNECIRCHGGEQGDLLGAFSYTLRPARYVDPHRATTPAKR